jgi:glutathione synthase/RimK-type ligase-like ATP-grasp enzyme
VTALYPYRRRSRSARRLSRVLGIELLNPEQQQPVAYDSVIINWGSSQCPYSGRKILNPPEAVRLASNKRLAFERMKKEGVSVPPFASKKEAVSWTGDTVVRHKLTGHSGEGIEIVGRIPELPDAPLYVKYVKKKDEYRIHVIGQEVVAIQRKARRNDTPDNEVNWQVRNHRNGFVFVRQNVSPPEEVLRAARDTIPSLGLDFGAVDVIFGTDGKAYVLEVNTAPGMEGQTINDYVNGFRTLIGTQ